MKVDPDLLQEGDVVYKTMRVGVGNTTLRTTNIYDVKIKKILRFDDTASERLRGKVSGAEVVWNGCNHETFLLHQLERLHATHPKPTPHPFWGQDAGKYAKEVEHAAQKAKEERKIWAARKKEAKKEKLSRDLQTLVNL